MNTQKVAITVPTELVAIIDDISRQKGISRSKLISNILKEKILNEKEKQIKTAYNRVFSDALGRNNLALKRIVDLVSCGSASFMHGYTTIAAELQKGSRDVGRHLAALVLPHRHRHHAGVEVSLNSVLDRLHQPVRHDRPIRRPEPAGPAAMGI